MVPRRIAPGGHIFHVINRAIAGGFLFATPDDYRAFERALAEACERIPMRILAYCLMPNHWHLVLQPFKDGDLGRFMHWLTTTHARRWRELRGSAGRGHIYQGTYRSFPVEAGEHLIIVCRYVERNALTAGLVDRAELWRWCSLWRGLHPDVTEGVPPLAGWPIERPRDWIVIINQPETDKELAAFRRSIEKDRPFGSIAWQENVAKELGLEATFRGQGRPRKGENSPGLFNR